MRKTPQRFFFLMGVGMILLAASRRKKGWSHGRVMGHLALRGGVIIVLEKLLWNPIIYGTLELTKFGVLFALGSAMLLGVLLLRFNKIVLLIIGLAGILITQMLPQTVMNLGFYDHPAAILMLVPQMSGHWVNIYPVFPWLSITALGMVFGKELLNSPGKAYSRLFMAGLICLILFPIVRGVVGDWFTFLLYQSKLVVVVRSMGCRYFDALSNMQTVPGV